MPRPSWFACHAAGAGPRPEGWWTAEAVSAIAAVRNTSTIRSMASAAELVCSAANNQMAGLRGGERRLDGVQIPYLADENHVRVLPEGSPKPSP